MKSVTIYLNEKKTAFQVIKPTKEFCGDWDALVFEITKGRYYSYKIF